MNYWQTCSLTPAIIATLICAAPSAGALAAEGPMQAAAVITIPSGDLGAALKELVRQTGVQLLYDRKTVTGVSTQGVKAANNAEEAISLLLQGTPLTMKTDASGAILISVQGAPALTANDGWHRTALTQVADGHESEASAARNADASVASQASDELAMRGIPEILVKGSRSLNADIVRTEEDAQPYYIFDSGVIQQAGAVNVEDFLKRKLPMNTVARTAGQVSGNFRGNQSSINLRGLGDNQTLVLINGRRTASPGLFSDTYQPDLNSIPPSAIERIEVLPSSSAAIYGGSAVGGVVNVVLKRGFTGGEVRVGYEDTFDGHAPIRNFSGTYGQSLEEGRTHVSVSAMLSEGDPLLNRDRPELLARGINTILRNSPSFISARNNPFWGATPNIGAVPANTNLTLDDGTPLNSPITSIPAGFTATSNPSGLVNNAGSFNTDLANSAQSFGLRRPIGSGAKVSTIMASLQRDMNDRLSVFLDVYRSSNTGRTPNYNVFSNVLQVPATAATNPFQQAVYVTIPDPYSGQYRARSSDQRATTGFTFKLPHNWMVSSDYTWSRSELQYGGEQYSIVGLNADLASGVLNPFVDTLAQPLDLTKYRGSFGNSQPATLNDITVRFAGPMFALPAGDSTLTVGLEHRKEGLDTGRFYNAKANYPNDSQYRTYFGRSQTIKSAYAEVGVPLIGEINAVPGVRLLDLQLSVRTERYEIGTGTAFEYAAGSPPSLIATNTPRVNLTSELESTNPTIGVRFKPVDSLMLRASYGTAFLPPGYTQLLPNIPPPGSLTLNVIDPRRGNELTNVEYVNGGNSALKPQKSKNLNIGMIFEPTFLPALRLNLEWYRLQQENVIFTPTAQIIVNNESQFADRITRAPVAPGDPYAVGALSFVDYRLFNANRGETEGLDLGLSYQWGAERYGAFSFSLAGTKVLSYKTQAGLNAPLTDIVNQVANSGPLQYKANAVLRWDFRNWGLGWLTNYYGSYPQYSVGGATAYVAAQGSRTIPSQDYHDFFVSYQFTGASGSGDWRSHALSDVTVQGGIRNVFDTVPPFDAFYSTSNYYSPFGDARLRSFYLTLAKKF